MHKIIELACKSTKNNYKDYKLFIANNIISFVSIFLLWNIFIYLYNLYNVNLLSFSMMRMIGTLCIALSAVSIAFTFYAIKRFTITRAYEYNILLNLGIKKKHFNIFVLSEYGSIIVLSLISGIILGNFLTQSFFLLMNNFDLFIDEYKGNLFGINLCIIMIYFFIVLSSFLSFLYFQHKIGTTQYYEKIRKNDFVNNKVIIFSVIGFSIGFILEIYSILLLFDFTIDKLFISMIVNIIGIFFIFANIGVIKKIIIKWLPKLYYKNLVKLNHIFCRFEQNRNIIWGVYIINFIGPFVVAGLLTTFILDDTNYNELYPYDIVYTSDKSHVADFIKDSNVCNIQEVNFLRGKSRQCEAICISIADYNKMFRSSIILKKGEILFYGQRRPEEFEVVADNKINITIGKQENTYRLVDTGWKILFGERLSEQLENVVVLSNIDFVEQFYGEKKVLGLVKYSKEINMEEENMYLNFIKNKSETSIFSKKLIVFSDETINKFNFIIVCIIGIFILWECSCILYIKNYSDLKISFYEKEIYELVGIKPNGIKNIFKSEMKSAYIVPVWIAMCMSTICFITDCFYETNEVAVPIVVFGIIILFYGLCQLLIYLISFKSLMEKLNIGEEI